MKLNSTKAETEKNTGTKIEKGRIKSQKCEKNRSDITLFQNSRKKIFQELSLPNNNVCHIVHSLENKKNKNNRKKLKMGEFNLKKNWKIVKGWLKLSAETWLNLILFQKYETITCIIIPCDSN